MSPTKFLLAAGAVLAISACSQPAPTQGSAEAAGEAADTQFEQATQGSTDLTDGPLENAGEAIDDAKENAADAAHDATGANPATTP